MVAVMHHAMVDDVMMTVMHRMRRSQAGRHGQHGGRQRQGYEFHGFSPSSDMSESGSGRP
jgi:hypothetical protein